MPKSTDVSPPQPTPDRSNDKLLTLEEIANRRRQTVATLRWLRNQGELDFVFRLGRRLVGWRSDCDADIDAAAARDAEARGAGDADIEDDATPEVRSRTAADTAIATTAPSRRPRGVRASRSTKARAS